MAASQKKLIGTIREILRTWHKVSYDELPEAYRLTLLAAAETASRVKGKPVDINWSIEEAWIGLRDEGLSRVVSETIRYYFPDAILTEAESRSLLALAQDADAKGMNVRAIIEESWRSVEVSRLRSA